MGVQIKVLTLNCWGIPIPYVCQRRIERMKAIGRELSKGEYDIVLLEEIWSQVDYSKLCAKLLTVLPHTHYFHSGVLGSGVCLFSKFPIMETLMHTFSLNGYPHKILHGDWYGSKMVGLAKVLVNDLRVNVYATHTHAEYNEDANEYAAHRVLQAFEMSQFIKHTSETCDAVVVGGDFNFQPHDIGYKLIVYNGNLQDSWTTQKSSQSVGTSACPHNSYTKQHYSKAHCEQQYPEGKCLDFLLTRANAGFTMKCDKCYLAMQKIPDQEFNYSDHEGVAAVLTITRNVTALPPPRESGEVEKHMLAAVPVIEHGLKKVKANQIFYVVAMVLCTIAMVFTSDLSLPSGLNILVFLIRVVMAIVLMYSMWYIAIVAKQETSALMACKKDINNVVKSNPPF